MSLILASASPRRRDLLTQMGFSFQVCPSDMEETVTETEPEKIVMELSRGKAGEVAERKKQEIGIKPETDNNRRMETNLSEGDVSEHDLSNIVILGADTLVFLEGEQMGKPKDEKEAFSMLSRLQGRVHQVYTGVTLIGLKGGRELARTSFYEETQVEFVPMTEKEIEEYVKTGEPMGKAGAYAIQGIGSRYIKRIEGDYTNVVGLPVARLYQEWKNFVLKIKGRVPYDL